VSGKLKMKFPLECLTLRRIHYERNVAIIIFCAFAFADTISSSSSLSGTAAAAQERFYGQWGK
jgi:hypothetical protein